MTPRERFRRRARKRRQERGVALIMVFGAMAVITLMLAELKDDSSAEYASASADFEAVQAEYFARSAVNLARLLIASEPTVRQAVSPLFMLMKRHPPQLPVWEYSDRLLGAFNDKEGAADFAATSGLDLDQGKNLGLKGGKFELSIVDEDSKINVNMGAANEIAHIRLAKQLMAHMAPLQYDTLFQQKDEQGNYHDRLTVCAALIDWADVDEQAYNCNVLQTATAAPAGGAVEDAWYQLLPKPFRRKNAPFDSLEELHMVRGVTDDFWATFVDPEPSDPKKRRLTVWGQGAVNVNSANPVTLFSLVCAGAPTAELCIDPLQMPMFVTGVQMAQAMTMGAPLFGSANEFVNTMKGQGMLGPMLTMMGVKPVKFQSDSEFAKTIATESKVFSIYAVGVVKNGLNRETRTSIHAVVDFRQAPSITGTTGISGGLGAAPGTTIPGTTTPATGTQAGATTGGIPAALQPSTGGQLIYYRIE
jgi:general secretion pathway protein K